ncbi:MAG: hypothetical protein U0232_05520 [Thermomicrobiales bacterium]
MTEGRGEWSGACSRLALAVLATTLATGGLFAAPRWARRSNVS